MEKSKVISLFIGANPLTHTLLKYIDLKVYQENYSQYDELKQYFEENPSVVAQSVDRSNRIEPKDRSPWESKF